MKFTLAILAAFALAGCAAHSQPPSAQAIHTTTNAIEAHVETVDFKGAHALDYFQ